MKGLILLLLGAAILDTARAIETAELNFGPEMDRPGALQVAKVPAWVKRVEQYGGRWRSEPRGWHVPAALPEGLGRIVILLDRDKMKVDLAATIVFAAGEAGDLAVQLFDAQGRSVATDLFGNLVDVGTEMATDTVIIPWRKYPSADRVVIRRIKGEINVFGVVLFPVAVEGLPVNEELQKLAHVLGDPLSPENPLLKGVKSIAAQRDIALPAAEAKPLETTTTATRNDAGEPVTIYAGASAPVGGAKGTPPDSGLIAYWNFDHDDARDVAGHGHDGVLRGGAKFADGIHGRALLLSKNPSLERGEPWDSVTMPPGSALDLHDSMTIAAWMNYNSIAPNWGSQVAWFGDESNGRDPWTLAIFTGGRVWFRSDRSVTGRPQFTVFEDEIYLSAEGRPTMNQHVDTWAPGQLKPQTWYFLTGTIERLSPRKVAMRLYVNGEKVSETITSETVNYPTAGMYMTIGAAELGAWQTFDGMLDEVRVYDRPLSDAEIGALYRQPWKR